MGADTNANTLRGWFERRAAYSSDCSVELPLRPSAIAAPPLSPSPLLSRLCRSGVRRWVVSRVNGRRHKSEHAGAGLRGLQKRALTLFEANTAKEGAWIKHRH